MSPSRAQILSMLSNHPQGLTAGQLADLFDAPAYNVSGVCTKLFSYGKIGRKAVEDPISRRPAFAWLPLEVHL